MFVKKSISNGKVFLSFVQGYRVDGKVRHKTIEKIGYLDELEKKYDDPLAHFKAIAKLKNETNDVNKKIEVAVNQRLENDTSSRKNLGYVIPKKIYSLLDINNFFQSKQKRLKVDYNLNSIFSLLTYNRFLTPSSKKNAYDNCSNFFESYDFSLDDVYRSLDYFSKYSKELQKHLYNQTSTIIERSNKLAYYDVTNYYFEIPYNDEDIYDDNGDLVKKGTRKKGVSKEHRKTPIIQMGLLMDSNGVPMAFDTFPGNESEKGSLLPIVKRAKKDFELERVIVVADRGLNTSDNTAFLSGKNDDTCKNNDGYVYGQSVLGADKEFKTWVLDNNSYVQDEEFDKYGEKITFTHKSRVYAKKIQLKDKSGKRSINTTIYQKQMVYYSKKYSEKQKKDRQRTIEKAKHLISNPGLYTRATSVGASSYVNNLKFVKSTGEIPDGLKLSLNLEKITEEEKYDGYYSIVTSEKHLTDKEIRDIYRGLWEIEESFKIIKSEFKARPIYVKTDNHIEAHFLICFVSLLIMRILEYKLEQKFSVKKIRNTLNNYSCSYLEQNYYLFDYRDDLIVALEHVFNIDLSKKYLTVLEIKKILQYH